MRLDISNYRSDSLHALPQGRRRVQVSETDDSYSEPHRKLTDEPSLYPGVSIKQIFRSKMVSPPKLFLRLRSRESSKLDHHSGYGFVLANISEIWDVELLVLIDLDRALGRGLGRGPSGPPSCGAIGSTCTMASQVWTIALIRAVLPMPAVRSRVSQYHHGTATVAPGYEHTRVACNENLETAHSLALVGKWSP